MIRISNEEMANYMNTIFNNEYFKRIISNLKNESKVDSFFTEIGNYTCKYYISTGDNSTEPAIEIINLYLNYIQNKINEEQFLNIYLNLIIKKIKENNNTNNILEVINEVCNNNSLNKFYTHCFPGSILEGVKESGLDINKEKFKQEFNILSKCFRTSYKTGELNYCDLSSASLSYATRGVPERVTYAIGGLLKRQPNESKYDWFVRSFKINLSNELAKKTINYQEYNEMLIAGIKIIDYYCTNTKSCIAVFKTSNEMSIKNNTVKIKADIINNLKFKISNLMRTIKVPSINDELIELQKENNDSFFDKYFNIINKYPILSKLFNNYYEKEIYNQLSRYIANLSHGGFADGYAAPNGKLDKSSFAISEFTTPAEVWQKEYSESKEHINIPTAEYELFDEKTELKNIANKINLYKNITEYNEIPQEYKKVTISNNFAVHIAKYEDGYYIVDKLYRLVGENILISSLNEKQLEMGIKKIITNQIINSPNLNNIIENYKNSDEYADEEGEELKYWAASWYADILYTDINPEDRKKYEETIIENNEYILLTDISLINNYPSELLFTIDDKEHILYSLINPNGKEIPNEILIKSKNNLTK